MVGAMSPETLGNLDTLIERLRALGAVEVDFGGECFQCCIPSIRRVVLGPKPAPPLPERETLKQREERLAEERRAHEAMQFAHVEGFPDD